MRGAKAGYTARQCLRVGPVTFYPARMYRGKSNDNLAAEEGMFALPGQYLGQRRYLAVAPEAETRFVTRKWIATVAKRQGLKVEVVQEMLWD